VSDSFRQLIAAELGMSQRATDEEIFAELRRLRALAFTDPDVDPEASPEPEPQPAEVSE
jgi:hypothetical protein